MAVPTPQTQFSRDILGNYVCNTIAEATNSGPFDVIIIGGGTFGLVLAQDFFSALARRPWNYPAGWPEAAELSHSRVGRGAFHNSGARSGLARALGWRIRVFKFPSSRQRAPGTRQELIAQGNDQKAIFEVWGLPWNSTERFGGLAYTLGDVAVFWRLVPSLPGHRNADDTHRIHHVANIVAAGSGGRPQSTVFPRRG